MNTFYNGKTVVVCGGCGMIGVQLVRLLVTYGAFVYVLDDRSRGNNTVESDRVRYITADAGNPTTCNYAFRGAKTSGKPVDVVFNLAASVAGVLHNMNYHLEMFDSNMRLQTVPLMVAEQVGVPNFLQTSSVCVYSPDDNHPSVEAHLGDEPHIANYGYAWAKRMGEKLVSVSQLAKAVIVRPSNVFGPMDYFDDKAHVIPALIKRATDGSEQMDMYGPGEYVREFIYSEDVARGMMTAMAFGENKEAYNIGTNGETRITMLGLAELVLEKVNAIKPIVFHPGKGGGDPLRWSNSVKLRALGWDNRWTLDRGLEETIEWYKNQTK